MCKSKQIIKLEQRITQSVYLDACKFSVVQCTIFNMEIVKLAHLLPCERVPPWFLSKKWEDPYLKYRKRVVVNGFCFDKIVRICKKHRKMPPMVRKIRNQTSIIPFLLIVWLKEIKRIMWKILRRCVYCVMIVIIIEKLQSSACTIQ